MFDSGVDATVFLKELQQETDIAYPVPFSRYVEFLSAEEQLLYSEIICEQAVHTRPYMQAVCLEEIPVETEFAKLLPRDVQSVFADDRELVFTTPKLGQSVRFGYYFLKNCMYVPKDAYKTLTLISRVRPQERTCIDNAVSGGNVHVPVPFLEMLREKIRGNIYFCVNEYGHSANHLASYNTYLAHFKTYIGSTLPNYGW